VILLDKTNRRVAATGNPHTLKDDCPVEWVRRFFHRDPTLGDPA